MRRLSSVDAVDSGNYAPNSLPTTYTKSTEKPMLVKYISCYGNISLLLLDARN